MELDFSRQLHFFWALLPEIILCTFGMVVLVAGVSGKYKDADKAPSGDPSFGTTADLGWLSLIGVLIAAAMFIALLAALTVLPKLILLWKPFD